jgi:hypothetical protein
VTCRHSGEVSCVQCTDTFSRNQRFHSKQTFFKYAVITKYVAVRCTVFELGVIFNVDAVWVMLVCQQGLCKNDTDCSSEVAVNGGNHKQYPTVPATCQLVLLLASQMCCLKFSTEKAYTF